MLKQPSREPQQQPLTSIEHGRFDTAALQQELAQALEDDRKYKLTDSMKKRAIHTAASYDEFKNLVACADLKPISQRELRSFSSAERTNNLSYKPTARKTYGSKLQFKAEATDGPPRTAVDFARQWKRSLKTVEEKYRYLRLTTTDGLGELFKNDIDADLLAEIVAVVVATWKQGSGGSRDGDHATFALGMLSGFTRTSRFALIVDFLDNNQIETLRDLFGMLEAAVDGASGLGEILSGLRVAYKV